MSRHLELIAGILAVALFLAFTPAHAQTADDVPPTAAERAAPLTPAGAPERIDALDTDEDDLQTAASVVRVDDFSEQSIHLFGVRSPDPSANGMSLYASFFPGGEWVIYPLAVADAYEVVSVQPGRIGIELTGTFYDGDSMDPTTLRRIIVSWTDEPDTGIPTFVTVTPAN